jgi:hypothetical protein
MEGILSDNPKDNVPTADREAKIYKCNNAEDLKNK